MGIDRAGGWQGARWHAPLAGLHEPTSVLPLVWLRVLFGLVMAAGSIRTVANGWVEALYLAPPFHFTYLGFEWVRPLPGRGMYLVFAALVAAALCIAAGLWYRASMAAFFVLFTYVELLDKAYYLNHYYFVSLLSWLLLFLPLHGAWSVDAWRQPELRRTEVPRWALLAVRLQLGLVYFFAGVAKLKGDWVLHALPLRLWLPGHTGFPLIGPLFDQLWVAYAMSWAGLLFDLTVPFLLFHRQTRPAAYGAVLMFHGLTGLLFPPSGSSPGS